MTKLLGLFSHLTVILGFADYLNVERTALSKELGKMQKDGILLTKKNHFKLMTPDI